LPTGAQRLWAGMAAQAGPGRYSSSPQILHIPAPLAVLAFLTEFLGSAFLIVGLFTRWAALFLAGEMVLAALLAHLKSGFFMNWTNAPNVGHGIEYNLALVGALLALVLAGGGRF
jgi:putative oxidoreductase